MHLICLGGKILRHSEINTNIVTWSRLLNRGGAAITAGMDTTSPMGAAGAKSTRGAQSNLKPIALNFDSDSSPPQSDTQSGENSPKTPDSRKEGHNSVFDKSDDEEVSSSRESTGNLPPLEPVSDADLMHTPDQIILPPPPEFKEESSQANMASKRKSKQLSTDPPRDLYFNGLQDFSDKKDSSNGQSASPLPELVCYGCGLNGSDLWVWLFIIYSL